MTWNSRGGGYVNNPPFVIPVQISQELFDFTPAITGYILQYIVNSSSKNQARQLFQQLAETNQSMLEQLAQDVADLTEFWVRADNLQPNQVEVAIRRAADLTVDAYLGYAVNQYPNEFRPVVDEGMVAAGQDYIRTLEGLKREAAMFYNQMQRGGGGWGNQGGRGMGGGARSWQPGNRGGFNAGGGGGGVWDDGPRTAANDGWPGNNLGNRNNRQGGGSGGSRVWEDAPASRGNTPAEIGYRAGAGTRPAREFNTRQPAPVHNQRDVQPVNPGSVTVDGQLFLQVGDTPWPKVKDPKRLFDWVLMEDGTQIRPAYQSNWKVSFDPQTPATPWYDPQTHILMHIKTSNGRVSAVPFKREEAMDYLDHELDPKLRRRAQDEALKAGGKVAAAWQLVEELRPNPSSPLSTAEPLGEDAQGHDVRQVNPGAFVPTSSLPDAIKRSILKLKIDHPHLLTQAFELYVDRGVLTTVPHPDFSLLFQVSTADSFRKVFHLLIDSNADKELVDEIDRRLAITINKVLTQNMGLHGWALEKFQEDYGELVAALKQDYGDQVVNTLEGFATEIVSRALTHYSKEDLDEIRTAVGLEPEQVALVWRERSSITRLPISAAELAMPADKGVMISEIDQPELFRTLTTIFDRTEDLPHTFHARYVATNDGEVYELARGYLNEQAVLLFKAAFTLS